VNITRECIALARSNLQQLLKLTRARTVILGLTWWHADDGLVDADRGAIDSRDSGALEAALVAGLDDLIDQLHRAGKQVVLIGPIAEPGWDIASTTSRQLAFGQPVDRPGYLPAADFARRFESTIRHFAARGDIGFARPDRVQCDAERCWYLRDGRSLFADHSHIAIAELPRFRALFAAALQPPTTVQP
jgi:hypothetical protein